MPTTPAGQALADAYSTAQARNAAIIAVLLMRLWKALINPTAIGVSTLRWLDLVTPQIVAYNAKAADIAQAFYVAYRKIEAEPGVPDFAPIPAPRLELDRIRTSLSVTGQVGLEKKIREIQDLAELTGAPPHSIDNEIAQAVDEQAAEVAGAGSRLVLEGGNDAIMSSQKSDKVAFGYARLAHADCCFFCAMLASRGPVYKDDSFDTSNAFFNGDGPAKVHDHDRCVIVPVFSREDEPFKESQHFAELYREAMKASEPDVPAILAFRRFYEGRVD